MTKIKHVLTIEIELEDLPALDRIELYEGMGCQGDPDDPEDGLPRAEDITSAELFGIISNAIEWSDDMWAGTDAYAQISSIKLLKVGNVS